MWGWNIVQIEMDCIGFIEIFNKTYAAQAK